MREKSDTIPFEIIGQYDYYPFGERIDVMDNLDRIGFIGKEKDAESNLGDFGVRKYEDFSGRFVQPEPLWEKYVSLSPYVYSANNPLSFLDPDGMKIIVAEKYSSNSDILNIYNQNSKIAMTERGMKLMNNLDGPIPIYVYGWFAGLNAAGRTIPKFNNDGSLKYIQILLDFDRINKNDEKSKLSLVAEEYIHAEQLILSKNPKQTFENWQNEADSKKYTERKFENDAKKEVQVILKQFNLIFIPKLW